MRMTEIFSVKREIPRQIGRSKHRFQFFARVKTNFLYAV